MRVLYSIILVLMTTSSLYAQEKRVRDHGIEIGVLKTGRNR